MRPVLPRITTQQPLHHNPPIELSETQRTPLFVGSGVRGLFSPKPVQAQEMGRNEPGPGSSVQHHPYSPVSPLEGPFSSREMLTMPEPAARSRRESTRELLQEDLEPANPYITDLESRRHPPARQWWWQGPRWQGLESRLITVVITGVLASVVLIICASPSSSSSSSSPSSPLTSQISASSSRNSSTYGRNGTS